MCFRLSLSRVVSLICLALLAQAWPGFLAAADKAGEKLLKGPIIQNVQTDRATLTWVTQRPAGQIRKAGGGEAKLIEGPAYHEVEITGLEPNTRYEYDLGAYGADVRGSFVTAPSGDVPFTFILFGDTRTRHEVHQRVVNRILAEKPAFVVHTGDLVNNGLLASDWDKYFEIQREFLRNVPFFPALGNHDRNAPVYFRFFSFPGANGHRYSFDWGTAHFIVINSNQTGPNPEVRAAFLQEQIEWVKQDLKNNKKPLTFAYFHHPLYSAVERRRESAVKLAQVWESIFIEAGVTAVFNGHDHNYQHHVARGLHHIVSGGGGAPLYDVSPIPGITVKTVKTENYVRFHVSGNKAKVAAVDLEGNILESFELVGRKQN